MKGEVRIHFKDGAADGRKYWGFIHEGGTATATVFWGAVSGRSGQHRQEVLRHPAIHREAVKLHEGYHDGFYVPVECERPGAGFSAI